MAAEDGGDVGDRLVVGDRVVVSADWSANRSLRAMSLHSAHSRVRLCAWSSAPQLTHSVGVAPVMLLFPRLLPDCCQLLPGSGGVSV